MTEKLAPEVVVRRYPASPICDVVVRVRGQEIVHRCPDYSHALKWARLECKSYLISGLRIEPPLGTFEDDHDLSVGLTAADEPNPVAVDSEPEDAGVQEQDEQGPRRPVKR